VGTRKSPKQLNRSKNRTGCLPVSAAGLNDALSAMRAKDLTAHRRT
jgi:hypothetical protein